MPDAFEIAGLVLGIIGAYPAVVSVLELYIGGLQARSSVHEDQVRAFQLDLGVQSALFENSYCILMNVQDATVLQGAKSSDWQKISDSIKLKITNEKHWATYGKLLQSIYECWNTLILQIPRPPLRAFGQSDLNWMQQTEEMLKRVEFVIKNTARCGLLNKLKVKNAELITLVKQQRTMRKQQRDQTRNHTAYFRSVQSAALEFCEVVASSLGCTCTSTHAITVELQSIAAPRSLADSSGGYASTSNSPLEMEMTYKPGINGTIPVPMKLELFYPLSTTTRRLYLQQTWQGLSRPSSTHCLAQSMERILQGSVIGSKAEYHIPGHESMRMHISRKQALTHNSITSLGSVIANQSLPCFQNGNFFERDRINMAIVLTCSVLGLHSTPWLPDLWTSDDIEFLPLTGNITRTSLQKPRVTIPVQRDSLLSTGRRTPSFGVRNNSLFALGMVLLEILMGASLASKRTTNESNIEAAWRLEHVVCSKELPFWKEVVSGCLHCPFSGIDMDLASDPPDLLDCVQTEVLQPLLKASAALP
ncbi:hypothetical protein BU16DRAFT_555993 [Lophium mytilinum]|uniref:DUF7580 domain-containing protein n=1 Tax=Lophium mytilinum TaxID=390894 RepID=A0A6A6RAE1_9PEZI|nr:hypothetical protein BU16DRAFT_555993 [Lophium mytilinum]